MRERETDRERKIKNKLVAAVIDILNAVIYEPSCNVQQMKSL